MPRLCLSTALILLIAGCLSAPVGTAPAPEGRAMEQELRTDMERSAAAWNAGDIAGHVSMYADSATMMVKAGPRGGREVIRGMLERSFWKDGKPYQQLQFSELAVTPLGREYAMMTGAFALSGGDRPEATGRFTLVWHKTSARWRIIHDHSS